MKRSFRVFGFCALLALVAYAAFVRENRRRTTPATKSEIVVAEDGTIINLRNNFTVVGPKSTTNASTSAAKK